MNPLRLMRPLFVLLMAAAFALPGAEEKPVLKNCLEATNPTLDFGTVAIGEETRANLFIYNFCDLPVPLKFIYLKPPFHLNRPGLPPVAPPLGFIALNISFKPVIPSPAMAKLILVGDTHTRVVLNARMEGAVARSPQVTMESEPAPEDSALGAKTPKAGG